MLATGIDHDRVYFRNPHGERQTDPYKLAGADHRMHGGGIESLPLDDFIRRTHTMVAHA